MVEALWGGVGVPLAENVTQVAAKAMTTSPRGWRWAVVAQLENGCRVLGSALANGRGSQLGRVAAQGSFVLALVRDCLEQFA
jgi:hypothetical protein